MKIVFWKRKKSWQGTFTSYSVILTFKYYCGWRIRIRIRTFFSRIRIRIRVTQKARIRPDPDPDLQHCFKLWSLKLTPRLVVLKKKFLRRPILLKHCTLLPLLEQSLSPFKRKSHRIFQNLQCNPTPLLDLTMFAWKNVRDFSW